MKRTPSIMGTVLVAAIIVTACGGSGQPAAASGNLRVGHTMTNGNCALDADNKLTGLCEGSGGAGTCTSHAPSADSPCTAGTLVTSTRDAPCDPAHLVSREHECHF